MYLNHEYMCPWIVRAVLPRLTFLARLPTLVNLSGVLLAAILSAAVALLTFCWVEYPFLQLRKIVLKPRPADAAAKSRVLAIE